jgi:hypothetical protein
MSLIEREIEGIWKETNSSPLKYVKFLKVKFYKNLYGNSRDIVCLSSDRQPDIKTESPRMSMQLKYNYTTITSPPPYLLFR